MPVPELSEEVKALLAISPVEVSFTSSNCWCITAQRSSEKWYTSSTRYVWLWSGFEEWRQAVQDVLRPD